MQLEMSKVLFSHNFRSSTFYCTGSSVQADRHLVMDAWFEISLQRGKCYLYTAIQYDTDGHNESLSNIQMHLQKITQYQYNNIIRQGNLLHPHHVPLQYVLHLLSLPTVVLPHARTLYNSQWPHHSIYCSARRIWHLVGCAVFSSALCYCTEELLSLRGLPSSVCPSFRPSSVKPVFSEPVKQIDAIFGGKISFHHISRQFLLFFKILHF